MKKKSWVVLALAASVSLGSGISAMAATGWVQEGSNWAYYNSAGSREYNEWRKGDVYKRQVPGAGRAAL